MHPTNKESMLLTVQQEDPDSSNNDSVKPDNVSEDELDMILATMGTTSLKDSELAILQDDASTEEQAIEASDAEEQAVEASGTKPVEEVVELTQQIVPDASAPPKAPAAPESMAVPSEVNEPSSRISARRVMKNFFKRLRNVK